MRVLAIDPSLTATGWAVHTPEIPLVTGRLESEAKGMRRLAELRTCLVDMLEEFKPQLVAYEGYAMGIARGGGRVFDLGELGGVFKTEIYLAGIDLLVIPPAALKRFMTGKGNAEKEEVRVAASRHAGVFFRNTDQADAYGLLQMGLALLDSRRLPRIRHSVQRIALAACEVVQGRK